MYPTIQTIHSYLAFVLLAGLVYSIVHTLASSGKPFTDRNKKAALIGLISCHLQLVVGLVLYFVSPLGKANLSAETMKVAEMRLFALEHPLSMLLGIVMVTIGYSQAKRADTDKGKFKSILIFYILGLGLILARIPWKTWL